MLLISLTSYIINKFLLKLKDTKLSSHPNVSLRLKLQANCSFSQLLTSSKMSYIASLYKQSAPFNKVVKAISSVPVSSAVYSSKS